MRRIAEFDGLRGLAASTVVAFHFFGYYLPWGWAALDVFFVLSGYLITRIVLEHGRSWEFLPVFYARRGLRIWPIYYLLLLFLAFKGLAEPDALPYYLTYTQELPRYWGGAMPTWLPLQHTWTLALEEQFYLVWPLIVLATGRRWLVPAALALALASIEARVAGFHWWTLLGHCDGFALGGLLAATLDDTDLARGRRRALGWAALAAGFAGVIILGLIAKGRFLDAGGPFCFSLHVTVASLVSFTLVTLAVTQAGGRLTAPLRLTPLVYLGTISYGLYLFHYPIVNLAVELYLWLGVKPGPALWACQIALALGLAIVSWHLFERPILKLRGWIPYPEPGGSAVTADEGDSPAIPFARRRLQPENQTLG